MEKITSMDFSDIETGEQLAPVSPGAILMHDFMEPMNLSANALAGAMCRGLLPDICKQSSRFGSLKNAFTAILADVIPTEDVAVHHHKDTGTQ